MHRSNRISKIKLSEDLSKKNPFSYNPTHIREPKSAELPNEGELRDEGELWEIKKGGLRKGKSLKLKVNWEGTKVAHPEYLSISEWTESLISEDIQENIDFNEAHSNCSQGKLIGIQEGNVIVQSPNSSAYSPKSIETTCSPDPIKRDEEECRRILVLDLDNTLINAYQNEKAGTWEPTKENCICYTQNGRPLLKRPYLKQFLKSMKGLFNVYLYTAATLEYTQDILKVIDPSAKYFSHIFTRKDCLKVTGEFRFRKTLDIIRADPQHIIVVDDSIENWFSDINNLIPIPSFIGDTSDTQLLGLTNYLRKICKAKDYREVLKKKYQLQLRLAACGYSLD